MTFEERLNSDYLKFLYESQISVKSAKGVDGVSPSNFRTDVEFYIIERKCLNDTYHFSPYSEKLISKGADKMPRIISVATVRDRLTLIVLKELLNDIYSDCINRELPNKKVREIYGFICQNPKYQYLKADIKGFFENINHDMLLKILRNRITDKRVVNLIEKAIKTPTFNPSASKKDRENKEKLKGIPQGLAISNILAEIYLSEFDTYMNRKSFFYSRYVDDILIVLPKKANEMKTELKKNLSRKDLQLNKSKTKCGKVKDGILFLGYCIIPNKIFVPEKKITLF